MFRNTLQIIYIYIYIALGIVTLLLAACAKESDSLVFTAKAPDYHNNTKDYVTAGSGTYDVRWSNGDQMVINGNTYAMSVSEMANSATVNATQVVAIGGKYYAAYPASRATVDGTGDVTFELPKEEHFSVIASGAGAGSQRVDNLMVAATSGTQLNFTNVCSLLHFALSGATGSLVAIEVASDQPIAGTINAHYDAGSWTTTTSFTASDTCRRLLFDTPLSLSSGQDIYMLMPAVSVTKFRLRFFVQMASGEVKVFQRANTGTSGMTFSAANLYNFGTVSYSDMLSNYADVSPSGSEDNPYLMFNGINWSYYMGGAVSSSDKYFELRNDLTVSDVITTTFNGTLEGNGHTVTLANNKPLLKEISGATIKNITVTAANTFSAPARYSYNDKYCFAPIVCNASSSQLIDCINSVNISSTTIDRIAGVCANASSCSFIRCTNMGNITSSASDVAGIVCRCATTGSIDGCVNRGNLSSSNTSSVYLGGIVCQSNFAVTNCLNYGQVGIESANVSTICYCGGVVAFGTSSSVISGCGNYGNVYSKVSSSTNVYVGGIIGDAQFSNAIVNCFNDSDLNTVAGGVSNYNKLCLGGITGHTTQASFHNCYSIGHINGYFSGGIVGDVQVSSSSATIENCYFYGTLSNRGGGMQAIVRTPANLSVSHCYWPSTVTNYYSAQYSTVASDCATLSNTTTLSTSVTLSDGITTTTSLQEALNDRVSGTWWPWITSGGYVVFNH